MENTPSERPIGEPFKGPVIPFRIDDSIYSDLYQRPRLHQFGKKVLTGSCLGYALVCVVYLERRHHGRGHLRSWRILDASEIHVRRLNVKEVFTPRNGEHFVFPQLGINPAKVKTSEMVFQENRTGVIR